MAFLPPSVSRPARREIPADEILRNAEQLFPGEESEHRPAQIERFLYAPVLEFPLGEILALEKLRDGRYKVDSDMIALFLSVKDTLEKVLRLYLTDVKAASDYDVSGADAQLKCFTQVAQSADKQNPPVLDLSEARTCFLSL